LMVRAPSPFEPYVPVAAVPRDAVYADRPCRGCRDLRHVVRPQRMPPGLPSDFAKLIAEETEKWGKVVKFAGIKPE
jgi:hypothetical protein